MQGGPLSGVRHIDHHADPIHLLDHLLTKTGDAWVIVFVTTRRQKALIIVRQLHEPRAQLMQDLYKPQVIINW